MLACQFLEEEKEEDVIEHKLFHVLMLPRPTSTLTHQNLTLGSIIHKVRTNCKQNKFLMYSKLFPVHHLEVACFLFFFPLVYKHFLILRLCVRWVWSVGGVLALPVSEWKLRACGDATFTIIHNLSQLASISRVSQLKQSVTLHYIILYFY